MRFEIFTAVQMSTMVLWIAMLYGLVGRPKDEHGMFLRNVGIYQQVPKAVLPKRPRSESSSFVSKHV
jgi:hypothetical protein